MNKKKPKRKRCRICGKLFEPKVYYQRYCRKPCTRQLAWYRRERKKRLGGWGGIVGDKMD